MLLGAWCIWEMRALVPEMKWAFSWEAVVAGVLGWALWVFLDPYYPKFELLFKMGTPWNPFAQYFPQLHHFLEEKLGALTRGFALDQQNFGAEKAWFFFWVRTLGSAIIIPPIEEVFYRSFLYRYCVRTDFQNMPLNRFHPTSFIVIALFFGMVHFQWIGGVLFGLMMQALVLRKNRLGDAILAHAITNFLLGLWIYYKGAWQFW
jgi:CAAX protease family protein